MDVPYVYHAPELINSSSPAQPKQSPHLNLSKIRKTLSITTFLFALVILPAVLIAVQFRPENVQHAGTIPTIAVFSATFDTQQTPWIMHLTGDNFSQTMTAKVFDNTTQWGEAIPVQYKTPTTAEFTFPHTDPPSHCILYQSCIFRVQLTDETTHLSSIQYSISINR